MLYPAHAACSEQHHNLQPSGMHSRRSRSRGRLPWLPHRHCRPQQHWSAWRRCCGRPCSCRCSLWSCRRCLRSSCSSCSDARSRAAAHVGLRTPPPAARQAQARAVPARQLHPAAPALAPAARGAETAHGRDRGAASWVAWGGAALWHIRDGLQQGQGSAPRWLELVRAAKLICRAAIGAIGVGSPRHQRAPSPASLPPHLQHRTLIGQRLGTRRFRRGFRPRGAARAEKP